MPIELAGLVDIENPPSKVMGLRLPSLMPIVKPANELA